MAADIFYLQREIVQSYSALFNYEFFHFCQLVKIIFFFVFIQPDCVPQVFQKENILEQLSKERDDLRTKLEEQKVQCVHVNQSKERLEADLAQSHDKLHISHLEVRGSLCCCLHEFMCFCVYRSEICSRINTLE